MPPVQKYERSAPSVEKNTLKEEREMLISGGARKRIKWTDKETVVLVSKHKEGLRWVDIQVFLPNRTALDCRDRWRNLKRKYEDNIENIYKEWLP